MTEKTEITIYRERGVSARQQNLYKKVNKT